MDILDNAEFYARREQQARELAEKADRHEVRMIHLRMADEYAAQVIGLPSARAAAR